MVAHGARGIGNEFHQPGGRHIEGCPKFIERFALRAKESCVTLNPRLTPWATLCRPPG